MLAQLARAIEELEVPGDAASVEEALRLRDRLDARISEALGALDAGQGWHEDGSASLTAWVAWHGRRSRREAHREAVVAKRLSGLPFTRAAWGAGVLSSCQVAVIVANVAAKHAGLFASQEAELVPALAELSVRDTARAMATWRLRAEALEDGPGDSERPSELYVSETMDGRRELSGHFRAEDGAVIDEAVAAASRLAKEAAEDGPLGAPERRAEALVAVCRQFLANLGRQGASGRNRPQVSVLVHLEDLLNGGPGHLADGTAVPGATVAWLSCDSALARVVVSARRAVLDYGTSTRSIPPALWAALVARDGHCRHPGCDRPPSWCEGHHITHFSQGGPTKLTNLALACARHHHLWHSKGWKLKLHPDATLDLVSPRGVLYTTKPPPYRLVS